MARRQSWQLPSLHRDEEFAKHRPVTWIELFLDLFVVVCVAQLARPVYAAHGWSDLGTFVAQFALLLWVWVGLTYYQERFETDGLENRVILFAFMLGISGMAVFAHQGLGQHGTGFIAAYCATRVFTLLLWTRAGVHVPEYRPVAVRYVSMFGIGQTCAFVSLWVGPDARPYLIGVAIVCEVITPLSVLSLNARLPRISSSKHPERFGLFTLIVLGEAVASVVSGLAERPDVGGADLARAALALLVGLGLWWIYFDFVGRRPFKPSPLPMYIWVYLHFALYLIIVLTGVTLAAIVTGVVHPFIGELGGFAIGGFLAVVGLLELVLHRRPDEPTHPVTSPALKLGCAPIAALSGYVTTGGVTQLLWMFAPLLVQMLYGVWVWFTQDLSDPSADHVD
jgi:low temperature requirement protein LtrA